MYSRYRRGDEFEEWPEETVERSVGATSKLDSGGRDFEVAGSVSEDGTVNVTSNSMTDDEVSERSKLEPAP